MMDSDRITERTPEQEQRAFTWLSPAQVAPMIGVRSAEHVRKLILSGELEGEDVTREGAKIARYVVSTEAVERYRRKRRRVAERLEERRRKRDDEAAA